MADGARNWADATCRGQGYDGVDDPSCPIDPEDAPEHVK